MITYWQQINGQFTKIKKENLDKNLPTWIDAYCVTRDETEEIQNEYDVEQDDLLDILDPDELSRMEDSEGYILIIVRVPVFEPDAETPYYTVPIGIIIKNKTIITICWTESQVIRDFGHNRVKNVRLADFPSFVVQIMNRANLKFLRYLKEINRKITGIQAELKLEVDNKEIIQMLYLERSLQFFATSLKSNQLLLKKMSVTRLINFDEEDIDFVEGVKIDNRQAIEMTDTYTNILEGLTDAYSSIISNNLNIVMKRLAVINIVMMVPTFITSFFGMNFPLPFEKFGKNAIWIVSALCIISTIVANKLLNVNREALKIRRIRKKIERKQKYENKKELRNSRKIKK